MPYVVDMALAGHVFEYGSLHRDQAFSLVMDLREIARHPLEDEDRVAIESA
jgi:hypothetical protein